MKKDNLLGVEHESKSRILPWNSLLGQLNSTLGDLSGLCPEASAMGGELDALQCQAETQSRYHHPQLALAISGRETP